MKARCRASPRCTSPRSRSRSRYAIVYYILYTICCMIYAIIYYILCIFYTLCSILYTMAYHTGHVAQGSRVTASIIVIIRCKYINSSDIDMIVVIVSVTVTVNHYDVQYSYCSLTNYILDVLTREFRSCGPRPRHMRARGPASTD